MIILDTSGVIAAYNQRENEHDAARAVLADSDERFVISPLVLAEIDYLAHRYLGSHAALTMLGELQELATVVPVDNEDFRTAIGQIVRYRDMVIGLTDAMNVVVAGRFKVTTLFSLDGHYRAVTPMSGGSFTLLPG